MTSVNKNVSSGVASLSDSDSDSELGLFGQGQTRVNNNGRRVTEDDNEDGMDTDLYGDLETNIFDRSDQPQYKSQKQLTARVHDVESRLVTAYSEIEQLKLKLKDLRKVHNTVLKNAASLHETAKLQIGQKNQVITQLQKKLQQFYNKASNPSKESAKELDDINQLATKCLSSVPMFSFPELCQEALQNLGPKKGDSSHPKDGKLRTKEWTKRFRHENMSCYFYSHHEETVHQDVITDIECIDDMALGRVGVTSQEPPGVVVTAPPTSCVGIPPTPPPLPNNSNVPSHTLPVPGEKKRTISSGSDSGELPPSPDPKSQGLPPIQPSPAEQSRRTSERRRSSDRSRSKDDLPPRDRNYGRDKPPASRKSTGDGGSYRGNHDRSRPSSNENSDRPHTRSGQLPPRSSSPSTRNYHESPTDRRRGKWDNSRRDERETGRDTRYRDRGGR